MTKLIPINPLTGFTLRRGQCNFDTLLFMKMVLSLDTRIEKWGKAVVFGGKELIKKFSTSCDGATAVTFALAAIPLIGVAGIGLDFSRMMLVHSEIRERLDSSVLAVVDQPATKRDALALSFFQASTRSGSSIGSISTPVFTTNADGSYTGRVSATIPSTLSAVLGISTGSVSATSTAVPSKKPLVTPCIFSLNPSASKALSLSSSSSINANGCGMQINSNNSAAVSISGSASITTLSNCIVGGVSDSSSGGVVPAPTGGCTPKADPFATLVKPTIGACNYTGYKVSSTSATLNPGVYCGGLTIASSSVTFQPGLYIIKDGLLTGSGGSSFYANGVTFFLTGTNAGTNISGGGNIHLVASNLGALAGFVFFLDPAATPAKKSVLSGTSELYYEGALYFPNQLLEMSGGSASFTPSPYTVFIADTILLSGGSALNIKADASATSVHIPDALFAQKGNGAYLMR